MLLLFVAIGKHSSAQVVFTMLIYAFFVYLPGLVAQALLELKGTSENKIWRKIVMVTSWYTIACGLFMSLFIIGYIILFVNCKG